MSTVEHDELRHDPPDADALPWRRPTVASLQQAAYKMREEIELKDRQLEAFRRAVEDAIEILRRE